MDSATFKQKRQKGAINLDQILKVSTLIQQSDEVEDKPLPKVAGKRFVAPVLPKFQFTIQCNEFFKVFKLKQFQKTMTFQTSSFKEGEDWITHIEYMRTKANLDHFVTNFGSFKVPQPVDSDQRLKSKKGGAGSKSYGSFASTLQRQIA
jgi:hypothetical protein